MFWVNLLYAQDVQRDSLALLLDQELTIADQSRNPQTRLNALHKACNLLVWDLEFHVEAIAQCVRGLQLSHQVNDPIFIQSFSRLAGISYANAGIFDESIHHFLIALNQSRSLDNALEPVILRNLASVYMEVGDTLHASFYLNEAIQKSNGVSFNLLNTEGNLVYDQNDYAHALDLYQQAYTLAVEHNEVENLALIHANLTRVFLKLNRLQEAELSAQKGMEYALQLNKPGARVRAHVVYCKVLLALNRYDEGTAHCSQALDESKEYGFMRDRLQVHETLSAYFQRQKLAEQALFHMHSANTIQNQIQKSAAEERSRQVNARLELHQQQTQNTLLQQKHERQRLLILITSLILFFSFVILAIFWRYSKQLRTARQELARHNKALEISNTGKDRLFSLMAHDLRNASMSVTGFVELVNDYLHEDTHSDLLELVQMLESGLQRQNELLTNMLLWSRSQLNAIHLSRQLMPIRSLIQQSITIERGKAAAKEIAIYVNAEPELTAYVDAQVFNLVIRNLLSNAIKFTDKQGIISITSKNDGEMLVTSVSDTGLGMAPDQITRLFQLGKINSRKGTANEPGTGLGLILCHEFIQIAGGIIEVDSELGLGTTFTFKLPQQPELEAVEQ